MFGIGMPELMIIFVIALLVFGPKELPKIAKTLGKAMAELRRASDDLRDGIQREIDLATREEPGTPPTPRETAPRTQMAEVTPPSPEAQTSMEAEAQGGETEAAHEAPQETYLAGPNQAGLDTATGEPASQGVVQLTLPTLDEQSGQPVMAGSPPSTGGSAEPGDPEVIPDDLVKAAAHSAPGETPKASSSKPETVPHVPA